MKKISLFLCGLLGACSSATGPDLCPIIDVPRETARQYITNNNYDAFQITIAGNENYCYTDAKTNQRYAVITPVFRVKRLEESTDSAIDVAFYINTSGQGNYMGKQVYPQFLRLPVGVQEQNIKGKTVKVRIAQPPYDGFKMELGFNLSDYALGKSKSMFDIDYKYLSDEELNANPETINNKYLEIAPDEKVVYCEKSGQPIVVKKGVVSYPCD